MRSSSVKEENIRQCILVTMTFTLSLPISKLLKVCTSLLTAPLVDGWYGADLKCLMSVLEEGTEFLRNKLRTII